MFESPLKRRNELRERRFTRTQSFKADEYQVAKCAQVAEDTARANAEARLPSDEQLYSDFAPNMTSTVAELDERGITAFDHEVGEPGMLARSGNSVHRSLAASSARAGKKHKARGTLRAFE